MPGQPLPANLSHQATGAELAGPMISLDSAYKLSPWRLQKQVPDSTHVLPSCSTRGSCLFVLSYQYLCPKCKLRIAAFGKIRNVDAFLPACNTMPASNKSIGCVTMRNVVSQILCFKLKPRKGKTAAILTGGKNSPLSITDWRCHSSISQFSTLSMWTEVDSSLLQRMRSLKICFRKIVKGR